MSLFQALLEPGFQIIPCYQFDFLHEHFFLFETLETLGAKCGIRVLTLVDSNTVGISPTANALAQVLTIVALTFQVSVDVPDIPE